MDIEKKYSLYPIFIWILAVFFYFYEFFSGVLLGTLAGNIMKDLHLTIERFSILGSAYFMTYSFMQIPVGILLDRFSIKFFATFAVGLCSVGMFLFSFSNNFFTAYVCRLLIGLGASFGFISLMVITLNWFPKKYFAFLIGCGQFLGVIGPLLAGKPVALFLKKVNDNWRIIFFLVALFGFILTIFFIFFFKGRPSQSKDAIIFVERRKFWLNKNKIFIKQPQIWLIVLYSSLIHVSLPLLAAFWGTTYLEMRGLSQEKAALMISTIWIGLAVGCPLFGRLSDLIKRRKPAIVLCSILGVMGSGFFWLCKLDNTFYLIMSFFFIGLAGSGQNLSFVLLSERVPKSFEAMAFGMNNTFLMGTVAVLPVLVASIMKALSKGDHLVIFALEKGLLVIPICFIISFFVSLFGIHETFCRHQYMIHQVKKA